MSDVVIRAKALGKKYLIGHAPPAESYDALRDVISRNVTGFSRTAAQIFRGGQIISGKPLEEFWALRDVDFEVRRGDIVGVIGRNGAGKSTLLKILSRITQPSTGRVEISGRLASLLEVGTGFHPELTGRENIFLNGAILGMTRAEIRCKFDEIVDFAEVERFLDTPVKRYSSGMYVRLAFAVAAHLEPEILVVDEVLAVGDVQFQKKCLGKIQDVAGHGRTVLFVSHNMAAIEQLTQRALLLKHGRMIRFDQTANVLSEYLNAGGRIVETEFDVERVPRKLRGTGAARIVRLSFDRPSPIFSSDEDFKFNIRIQADAVVDRIRASMTIFCDDGSPVGSSFGSESGGMIPGETKEFCVILPVPNLAPGRYYCGVAVGKGDHRSGHIPYDMVLNTLGFEVRPEVGESGTLSQWHRSWGPISFPNLVQHELSKDPALSESPHELSKDPALSESPIEVIERE